MFGGTVIPDENFNGFDFVNRHDIKVDDYLRQRPMYNFVHHYHAWIKPVLAEFVATFIFTFWIGLFHPLKSDDSPLMPALAIGFGVMIMVTAFWDICIIQFNPAGKFNMYTYVFIDWVHY